MAYIELPNNLPGIRGLMAFRPEVAKQLNLLAESLLRAANSLTVAERELIATFVSHLNGCHYCQNAHGALVQYYYGWDNPTMDSFKANYRESEISEKMKSLLTIAESVQKNGKEVTSEQIKTAKYNQASDREIHDTVLIAAAFCMFNRYVDGLGTEAPAERDFYLNRAEARANEGYAGYDPLN